MERNIIAEEAYAAAWINWNFSIDPAKRRGLEFFMDSIQSDIAEYPNDPRWNEFINTLPGYVAYWEGLRIKYSRTRIVRYD